MNPLSQMLNNGSNNNMMGMLGNMMSGNQNPQMMLQMLMNNPQFKSWLNANKDKTIEQIMNGR